MRRGRESPRGRPGRKKPALRRGAGWTQALAVQWKSGRGTPRRLPVSAFQVLFEGRTFLYPKSFFACSIRAATGTRKGHRLSQLRQPMQADAPAFSAA